MGANGLLRPLEGVAEVCAAEPLGVCFEGVKVTVEAEKAGRIAIFDGVIDDLGVDPFAIPFAAWSRDPEAAFEGVAVFGRCVEGEAG